MPLLKQSSKQRDRDAMLGCVGATFSDDAPRPVVGSHRRAPKRVIPRRNGALLISMPQDFIHLASGLGVLGLSRKNYSEELKKDLRDVLGSHEPIEAPVTQPRLRPKRVAVPTVTPSMYMSEEQAEQLTRVLALQGQLEKMDFGGSETSISSSSSYMSSTSDDSRQRDSDGWLLERQSSSSGESA